MKRKIIALVLVLSLLPSIAFAKGLLYSPKVETKSVSYYSNQVLIDGLKIKDTVTIDGEVYINANALAGFYDKDISKGKEGTVLINKKDYNFDFARGNWGQSKAQIIKNVGYSPKINKTDSIIYNSQIYYGLICDVNYLFTNNKLTAGHYFLTVNDQNCLDIFKHMTNLIYEQFDSIEGKGIYYKNDIADDTPILDAIKNDDIYLYAEYLSDTTQAFIFLQSDNKGGLQLGVSFYDRSVL